AEARAHLGEDQVGDLLARLAEVERLEEGRRLADRERAEGRDVEAADLPVERLGLEARPVALLALEVPAVAREEDADAHLVRLALELLEPRAHDLLLDQLPLRLRQ